MNFQKHWLKVILCGVSLLLLVACGGGGTELPTEVPSVQVATDVPATPEPQATAEEMEPTAVATEAEATPAETTPEDEVEEPEAEGDAETAVFSLNAENNFGEPINVSTYKISLTYESTVTNADGTITTGQFILNGERDIEQDAFSFTVEGIGTADFEDGNLFTFLQLEDTTYIQLPDGQCAAISQGIEDDPYTLFLEDGGFLGELDQAELATPPTETINGVETTHYTFNETNLNPLDADTATISTLSGNVWVAQEGDYVVRILMEGVGEDNLISETPTESNIRYELNYFDFDQPVSFTIPDSCTSATETEFPVLSDAFGVNALPGAYTYQSNSSVEDAVDFYKEQMEADGWALTQDLSTAQGGLMTFSKDGQIVQIAINVMGDGISVGIISTP